MLNILLPFSRKYFNEFYFHIKYDYPDKDSIIVNLCNYKFKIYQNNNNLNKKLISFGRDKKYNYFILEKQKVKNGDFQNIISSRISEKERLIAGIARAVLDWCNDTKFCGCCGDILNFHNTESAKYCQKCRKFYFPKLNPAVIVIVKKNNSILLTRKKEWKADRYGIVAGFVEYGESAEEAVVREIYEETKLKIKNLKYIASQFWPFPYQLMLGYEAQYSSGNIEVDTTELEEARWFDINNLPILPPKASIARYLIDMVLNKKQI